MQIITSRLIEENAQDPFKYTTLPVMELSVKILSGVEVLKNGYKQAGVVWEQEKFMGDVSQTKEFKDKVIKAFDRIMSDFVEDYKKANPTKKINEIQFFLYA